MIGERYHHCVARINFRESDLQRREIGPWLRSLHHSQQERGEPRVHCHNDSTVPPKRVLDSRGSSRDEGWLWLDWLNCYDNTTLGAIELDDTRLSQRRHP